MRLEPIALYALIGGVELIAQAAPATGVDFVTNASNWTPLGAVLVILVYLVTKALPEKDKLHREALREVCETHTKTADKICLSLDALAKSSAHDTGIILDECRRSGEEQREYDAVQRELERKSHAELLERMAGRCDQKIERCRETNHALSNALQVHRVQVNRPKED